MIAVLNITILQVSKKTTLGISSLRYKMMRSLPNRADLTQLKRQYYKEAKAVN